MRDGAVVRPAADARRAPGGVGKTRLAVEAAARSVARLPRRGVVDRAGGARRPRRRRVDARPGARRAPAARLSELRRGGRLPPRPARAARARQLRARRRGGRARRRGAAARLPGALDPRHQPRAARDPRRDALGGARRSRCRPARAWRGLSDSDAARLFVDRAGRVDRWRPLTDDSAWAIAEICRQLEGIPLALELAAARVAVLSPEAIARGLEDALEPAHGAVAAPPRRATRRCGRRSTGATGCCPRTPACCCGGSACSPAARRSSWPARCARATGSRRSRSSRRSRRSSSTRWSASTRTAAPCATACSRRCASTRSSGSTTPASATPMRDRHRDAFLALAERQRREALTPRQPEVFAALDPEAANLAAALDRALETDPDKALRLCLALDFWYRARARFREADDAYARAVAASDPPPVAAGARARRVGVDRGQLGRLRAGRTSSRPTPRRAPRPRGDEGAIAFTLLVLANHRFFTDPLAALELICTAAATSRARRATSTSSRARRRCCAASAWFQQDEEACGAGFDELRPRLERLGDRETLAWFWFEQGADPLPARRARRRRSSCSAARSPRRPRSASRRPTAPPATYLALIDVAAGHAPRALRGDAARSTRTRCCTAAASRCRGSSCSSPQAEAGSGRLDAARGAARDARRARGLGRGARAGVGARRARRGAAAARRGRRGGRARRDAALERARALGNDVARREGAAHARPARRAARGAGGGRAPPPRRARDDLRSAATALELPAALEALAEVAAGLDSPTEAARILGAAERARRELGFVAWPAQRAEVAALTARLRRRARRAGARRDALAEGAALDRDDAVAWLRRARGARKRPARGWESLDADRGRGRPPRRGRADQPADRRAAVHHARDGQDPPLARLRQARRAQPLAARRRRRRAAAARGVARRGRRISARWAM